MRCGISRTPPAFRETGLALREMSILAQRLSGVAVLILLGLALGWIGPYGTYTSLALPSRIAFWTLAMLSIGIPAHLIIRRLEQTPPSASWPVPVQAMTGTLINAVPSTFIVIALNTIFIRVPPITPAALGEIYVSVLVLGAVISIPWSLIRATRAPKPADATEPAPAAAPEERHPISTAASGTPSPAAASPFLRRIPPKLGTELLCIATEDHYLRIVTDRGSDLILFRFSDALAELRPMPGQQVHRSYWVAERAVASVEQDGNRTFLVLTNGVKVPVSQTFLPAIRQRGWLERRAGPQASEFRPDPLPAKS